MLENGDVVLAPTPKETTATPSPARATPSPVPETEKVVMVNSQQVGIWGALMGGMESEEVAYSLGVLQACRGYASFPSTVGYPQN